MNKHVLKLRKRPAFMLWRDLHSQACQNVCRRVDDAYQRFFKGLAKGRPKFKKARKYSSFTFPQSGYKLDGNTVATDGTQSVVSLFQKTCRFAYIVVLIAPSRLTEM
jgi:transposase